MSATLDDLLKIEGVQVAFEFSPDGQPVAYKAKEPLSPEAAAMITQFCATVTMNFNTLAGSFSQLSQQAWVPQQGWMYAGGDYSVAIGGGGYKGVFIESAKADFNQLYRALVEA
jgi:roadblock/LC7 domain-containing protein